PTNKDLEEGRNFQMLLYLLAAQRILQEQKSGESYRIRGGLFWSIQRNKSGGELLADDPMIQAAREALHQKVLSARRGWFPNQPRKLENGKCFHHCEFSQFCRVNRASQRKPAAD
ncbi:MAG TPA: PD-(D/E)XK nuclease family protein, partial [Aggregatilineales bacterium]|nr:PD-(D/E)XK nuclease family protein [Aggregatilineales bacterium]